MKKLEKISNGDWNKLIQNQKNYQKLSLAYDLLDQVYDIIEGFGDNGITIKPSTVSFEAINEEDDNIEVSQFIGYLISDIKSHILNVEMNYLQKENNKILGIK